MALKGIEQSEQPREKALMYGIESLSNQELLSILLRCGSKKETALELSNKILEKSRGMANLMNITFYDLISIDGIKKAKALTILAALELNKRVKSTCLQTKIQFHSSKEAYEYIRGKLEFETQEKVIVLFVNTTGQLIKEKLLFTGSLNMSIISSKEICKEALLCNSAGFFLFHNHPSGSSLPSNADIEQTKKIQSGASCFDIVLMDHIVVGKNEYYSFRDNHVIE